MKNRQYFPTNNSYKNWAANRFYYDFVEALNGFIWAGRKNFLRKMLNIEKRKKQKLKNILKPCS